MRNSRYRQIAILLSTASLFGAIIVDAPAGALTVARSGSVGEVVTKAVGVTISKASGRDPRTLGIANAVVTGVGASSIPITVSVGNPVQLPASSGAEYSVTTVVGMGQITAAQLRKPAFSGNVCGSDSSYAVYQCTTMYYSIKSDSSNFYADDQQVSIQATNNDPGSAGFASASLAAGVSGAKCGGGGLSNLQTWNISLPTSGTTYNRTPSWSGGYYRLSNAYSSSQGVTGTLHWVYRGNAETLAFTYTLPDSEPGWPTGGC